MMSNCHGFNHHFYSFEPKLGTLRGNVNRAFSAFLATGNTFSFQQP